MKKFEDKVAFISGASKGIGLACAERLASEGAKLFLAASNEDRLARAAEALTESGAVDVCYHAADLRTLEGCRAAAMSCLDQFGRCDIFIHSAGATKGGIFPAQPDEEMVDGFALKFHAGVRLARVLWPSLKQARGTVVNIVGGAARTPAANFMVGGAVNAALANFSKALAGQGLQDNVNVNWVNPGMTVTERLGNNIATWAAQQEKTVEQMQDELVSSEGIRRLGQPEDVAELVAFLCSPEARHIQGSGISVDGGGSKGYW